MRKMTLALSVALVSTFALGLSSASAQLAKVDGVHSFVIFGIHHFNAGNVWGRFNDPSGEFKLDGENSMFNVSIPAANIDTNNKTRDDHLKGPDFFAVKQHPTITFKSTAVKKLADDKLEVTGDLTLRGVTKSITVPVQLTGTGKGMMGETRMGVQAEFTIKRSDYGMNAMMGPVGDEVRLIVALEGIRQ